VAIISVLVFGDADRMPTTAILAALHDLKESPWGDLRGKPLDDRGLAKRLHAYGIKSTNVRVGAATPKGYRREDLVDAWQRYLPPSPDKSATSATIATETVHVADVADVALLAAQRRGRTCAQCGDGDGMMVLRSSRDQEQVFLHAECERFWRAEGRASLASG
jgi:Protein of unknown function (DUF3631)